MHGAFVVNQHIPKLFILFIGLLILCIISLIKRNQFQNLFIRRNILLIAFVLSFIPSLFWVQDITSALERIISWLCLLLWYFIFTQQNSSISRAMLWGYLLGGTGAACWGLAQSFFPHRIESYALYVASFGNTNFAAECMIVLIWIAFYGLEQNIQLEKKFFLVMRLILGFIDLIYLIRTECRTAWLALALGIFFYIILSILWKKKSRAVIHSLIACIVLLSIIFIIPKWRTQFLYKCQSLFDTTQGSTAVRLSLWKNTTHMIYDHLFWGVGTGQFIHNYPFYRDAKEYKLSQGRIVHHPHNEWLLITSELGIIPTCLLLLYILFTIISLYRKRNALILSCLLSLGILTLFATPLQNPCLFIAFSYLFSLDTKKDTTSCNAMRFFIMTFIAIFSIIGIYFSFIWMVSEAYYTNATRYFYNQKYKLALEEYDDSLKLHASNETLYQKARTYYALQQYTQAIELYEKGIQKNPEYEGNYSNLGLCYLKINQSDKALAIWLKGLSYYPCSSTLNINLLEYYATHNEITKLENHLKQWENNIPDIIHNTNYLHYKGRYEELVQDIAHAIYYYSCSLDAEKNPVTSYYLGCLLLPIDANAGLYHLKTAMDSNNINIAVQACIKAGIYYETQGNRTYAAVAYIQARKCDYNNPLPHLYLAQIALQNNKTQRAIQYLIIAKKIGYTKEQIETPSLEKLRQHNVYKQFTAQNNY